MAPHPSNPYVPLKPNQPTQPIDPYRPPTCSECKAPAVLKDSGLCAYCHQATYGGERRRADLDDDVLQELAELRAIRDDWEVIEAWCSKHRLFDITLYRGDDGEWFSKLVDAHGMLLAMETLWEAPTRAKALSAAAEWCRKERSLPDD